MITFTEWMVILLVLVATLFWLFMLVQIARKERGTMRVVWLVGVALTHWLGAVAYLGFRGLAVFSLEEEYNRF
jgi:hypothetical protein